MVVQQQRDCSIHPHEKVKGPFSVLIRGPAMNLRAAHKEARS
jgi:hypothetical protein